MKIRRVAASIAGLLGLFLAAGQVHAKPTACDVAAAHPDDPDKVLPGLERSEIDLDAAVAACREVLETAPDHARTNYLLGRVLFYQGRAAEALPYLRRAADAGYRQSIFVLGYIDIQGFGPAPDPCNGLTLLRQGASLDHPWSGYHLVNGTLEGTFAGCENVPGPDALDRYMSLASENITVAASEGRVEALAERLAATRE